MRSKLRIMAMTALVLGCTGSTVAMATSSQTVPEGSTSGNWGVVRLDFVSGGAELSYNLSPVDRITPYVYSVSIAVTNFYNGAFGIETDSGSGFGEEGDLVDNPVYSSGGSYFAEMTGTATFIYGTAVIGPVTAAK